jgi:hypothetical protein
MLAEVLMEIADMRERQTKDAATTLALVKQTTVWCGSWVACSVS